MNKRQYKKFASKGYRKNGILHVKELIDKCIHDTTEEWNLANILGEDQFDRGGSIYSVYGKHIIKDLGLRALLANYDNRHMTELTDGSVSIHYKGNYIHATFCAFYDFDFAYNTMIRSITFNKKEMNLFSGKVG